MQRSLSSEKPHGGDVDGRGSRESVIQVQKIVDGPKKIQAGCGFRRRYIWDPRVLCANMVVIGEAVWAVGGFPRAWC